MTDQQQADEVIAEAERLKAFIRKHSRGGCRLLSLGEACKCPLCDLDALVSLVTRQPEQDQTPFTLPLRIEGTAIKDASGHFIANAFDANNPQARYLVDLANRAAEGRQQEHGSNSTNDEWHFPKGASQT